MRVSDEIIEEKGSEVEALYGLAKLLNTGLDRRVLALLLELLECGVHPDSLVDGRAFSFSNRYCMRVSKYLNIGNLCYFWLQWWKSYANKMAPSILAMVE